MSRQCNTFASALFNALIIGEVRSRYDVSQERARQQGKGMRIRLRIQSPELAALPREFLYDPRRGSLSALSRNTPLVRYLELSQPVSPLAVTPPLRILGMVASPTHLQKLDVPVEKQRIEQAISALQQEQIVELHWLAGASWRDLQPRHPRWPVAHFSLYRSWWLRRQPRRRVDRVHQSPRPCRVFHGYRPGPSARRSPTPAPGSAQCLREPGVATMSSQARRPLLCGAALPVWLTMQYAISDYVAIEFAQTFYESLADNLPVDTAVAKRAKPSPLSTRLNGARRYSTSAPPMA